MAKNILFIGAGASFGARETFHLRPPLGPQLADWLRSNYQTLMSNASLVDLREAIDAGSKVLFECPQISDFELLLSKLDNEKRSKLQRLIQVAFSDFTERPWGCSLNIGLMNAPDGYDKLVKMLSISPRDWAIISLNYDLLFEEALRRIGIDFYYPHFPFEFGRDQSNETGVAIYKPHGSINFFAQADQRIFHHQPEPTEDRGLPTEYSWGTDDVPRPNYPIVFAGMAKAENVLARASNVLSKPVMANYTKGKDVDINDLTLEKVRHDALNISREAEQIVIIGVKPILDFEDDPFVTSLLNIPAPKMIYVSGSMSESEQIKSLHGHAEIHSDGLLANLDL